MKAIFNFFWIVFHPSYWLTLYPYSKEWDKILKQLMRDNKFKYMDSFTTKLGDKEIWIANHPYASFRPYIDWRKVEVMPSRITIRDAHKKLMQDLLGGE